MFESPDTPPIHIRWRRQGLRAKFTHGIELDFTRHYNARLLVSGRWGALAAILVMLGYTAMDFHIAPAAIRPALFWLRCMFAIAPLSFLVWASFQTWGQRHSQPLSGLVSVSVGLTVVSVVSIASQNGAAITYERVILAIFFFYCCGGMRLNTAVLAGLIISLAHVLAEYYYGQGMLGVLAHLPLLVISNFIGIFSASIIESSARRNFSLVAQLHNQASRDYLTGLFNRRALRQKLDVIWQIASEERQAVTLAMIDVDLFKSYNDTYGHMEGDKVLRQIAEVLHRHTQRPFDATARFGGEEFVCVWTGNDPESVAALLDQIRCEVSALNILHSLSPYGIVSISIGAVQLRPDQGNTIKAALHDADQLLYQAKLGGRNRVVVAVNDGDCLLATPALAVAD